MGIRQESVEAAYCTVGIQRVGMQSGQRPHAMRPMGSRLLVSPCSHQSAAMLASDQPDQRRSVSSGRQHGVRMGAVRLVLRAGKVGFPIGTAAADIVDRIWWQRQRLGGGDARHLL